MTLARRLTIVSLACLLGAACTTGGESTTAREALTADAESTGQAPAVAPIEPATGANLFEQVTERARRLALVDYAPPSRRVPEALANLDYDQYRLIAFRPEAALWHDRARFAVQLVHPGFLYQDPVRIHEVQGDRVVELPLDPNMFRYQDHVAPIAERVTPDLGHAGFRVY